MKTTVMFVADSIPLGGVPVRIASNSSEDIFVTDPEGKVELDLELGTHTFAVEIDEEWIERTVHRQGHASLFVVNVNKNDAQNFSSLNTLQVDLANLVGDRYVFETVLGRGGMGVVVKAVDRMLNRPVAIKLLSDELRDNEEAQQIFLVEARNLATLSHPNLVAIHDILNVGGRVLMVFEYVLGENVEQMIKRVGGLDQKEVLRIAIQLTRCVSYLHDHELIHRDLKPANIIVQAEGTLKLIDFGLARSLNELYIRGTRVRGTPAYMAPEQIQGIHLTTQTDIYQIGISMFEMLAGQLPFDSGDLAYAHVHLDPPPLTENADGVDPELARLVHACLEKRPKDRPSSADVLLEQLQQIYARIASSDTDHDLLESVSPPVATGHQPALSERPPATESEPALSVEDAGDVSIVQEFAGGSNRGLMVMLAVGLVALGVGAFVLLTPDGPDEVTEVAPPPEETTPTSVVTPEPAAPEADPAAAGTVRTASELVTLGVTAAKGRAVGMAAATADPVADGDSARPADRAAAREAEPEPPRPVADEQPTPTRVTADERAAEGEAKEKKPKAKLQKTEDSDKGTGLLSVDGDDDGASNSLLPVGE